MTNNVASHVLIATVISKKETKWRKLGIDGPERVHNRLVHKTLKSLNPRKIRSSFANSHKNLVEVEKGVSQKKWFQEQSMAMLGPINTSRFFCNTDSSQTWVEHGMLENGNLETD